MPCELRKWPTHLPYSTGNWHLGINEIPHLFTRACNNFTSSSELIHVPKCSQCSRGAPPTQHSDGETVMEVFNYCWDAKAPKFMVPKKSWWVTMIAWAVAFGKFRTPLLVRPRQRHFLQTLLFAWGFLSRFSLLFLFGLMKLFLDLMDILNLWVLCYTASVIYLTLWKSLGMYLRILLEQPELFQSDGRLWQAK